MSKKELSSINRSIEKYKKSLDGIKEMTRLPDAVFIVDVGRESIAVKEANRLGIPIVAIVDSNCDPESIDFVVPGNDDSTRAIQLYCQRVADACAEGALIFNERVQSEVSEQERARAHRRGRREDRHGPRRGRDQAAAAARARHPQRGAARRARARKRAEAEAAEPAEREEPAEAPSAPAPASE